MVGLLESKNIIAKINREGNYFQGPLMDWARYLC